MSTKAKVKKAQSGNADAFLTLMEDSRQTLLRRTAYTFFNNGHDVGDALQDTILAA